MPKKRERNKSYSIWCRRLDSGRRVFYVRFRNEEGGWRTARSSGCSTKAAAEAWAAARVEKAGAMPALRPDRPDRYRSLADLCPEAACRIDSKGRVLYANRRVAALLGYPEPSGLVGKPCLGFLASKDRALGRKMLLRRRSGLGDRYEATLAREDGSVLRARIVSTPLFEDGAFDGSFATLTDIAAEKAALLRQLRASERRITDMVDRFPIAVCAIGLDSLVKYMNCVGGRLFHPSEAASPYPASLRDRVFPDDRERYDRAFAAALRRSECRSLIMEVLAGDSGRKLALWRFSPILEEGRVLGAYVAIIEIGAGLFAMNRLPSDSFYDSFPLSDRERDIADLLLSDYQYKEIASLLSISLPTARTHVMSLYRKACIHSRDEFFALAKRWQAARAEDGR